MAFLAIHLYLVKLVAYAPGITEQIIQIFNWNFLLHFRIFISAL